MIKHNNAGKYNQRIEIYRETRTEDTGGFNKTEKVSILKTWANVRTVSGFTLIVNNTDFEKAFVNFTIRYPKPEIASQLMNDFRELVLEYENKQYSMEYVNNIDERDVEFEIQAKLVRK